MFALEMLSERHVVVNLAVDAEHGAGVAIDQRLGAVLDIHDREALMGDDRAFAGVNAAPIGAAVAHARRHRERLVAQHRRGLANLEYADNAAHSRTSDCGGRGENYNQGYTGVFYRRFL